MKAGVAPRVHLINPSHVSFGVAVITPRWLYVLAAATGTRWGDPHLIDETLEETDFSTIAPGDVVGIGIHTGNAKRGYEIGQRVRALGAWVVFGGIHATLYPDEAREHGHAHAVVKGDGDLIWSSVVEACFNGTPLPMYDGGRVAGDRFLSARWAKNMEDLRPRHDRAHRPAGATTMPVADPPKAGRAIEKRKPRELAGRGAQSSIEGWGPGTMPAISGSSPCD